MTRTVLFLLAALSVGAATLPETAGAQARGASEAALLRRRVVQLEDRVAVLERQLAAVQEAMRAQQEALAASRSAPPGPSYLQLSRTDGWRNRENWRLLRRGLSQLEVRYLLGEPGGVEAGDLFTRWYYPDPRGGSVRFDALGGRLESWSEPW